MTVSDTKVLPTAHQAIFPPVLNVACCLAATLEAGITPAQSSLKHDEPFSRPNRHDEEDPERWDGMA